MGERFGGSGTSPKTGTLTALRGPSSEAGPPGSNHYNAAWEVDSVASSRSIDNDAVVRLQNRYQASGTGNIYCDGYIDWHITDSGSYWSQGPYGCLTPVY